MWKKNKGIIKYDKSTIIRDVGIVQCEDSIIKCEKKKIRELQNVTKVQSYVMLVLRNVKIVPSNVRKKKERGTTKYDKNIVTWDIDIA